MKFEWKIINFPRRKKFRRNKSDEGELRKCFRIGPDLETWEKSDRFGRKEKRSGVAQK